MKTMTNKPKAKPTPSSALSELQRMNAKQDASAGLAVDQHDELLTAIYAAVNATNAAGQRKPEGFFGKVHTGMCHFFGYIAAILIVNLFFAVVLGIFFGFAALGRAMM